MCVSLCLFVANYIYNYHKNFLVLGDDVGDEVRERKLARSNGERDQVIVVNEIVSSESD